MMVMTLQESRNNAREFSAKLSKLGTQDIGNQTRVILLEDICEYRPDYAHLPVR